MTSGEREVGNHLHRLRSVLARVKMQLELAAEDGERSAASCLAGMGEALELLAEVENVALCDVVVIDDDERLAELTARRLRRAGFHAVWASDLSILRWMPTSSVIADLGVLASAPRDLVALCTEMRPIISTGRTGSQVTSALAAYNAAAALTKPVDIAELVELINAQHAAKP